MAFCEQCGAQLNDGMKACPSCGAPIPGAQTPPQQNPATDYAAAFKNINNTPDSTANFHPADIQQNKFMAVLAYLGILWLIPFFANKQSPYTQYHCKQGLNVILLELAYTILSVILSSVIRVPQYFYGVYIGSYTPGWLSVVLVILSLPILALAVLGIINAATGKAKELPIIGKIKILK